MYDDLDDDQLRAEIAEYRKAIKTVAIGGGAGVIAGEGHRIEISQPNLKWANAELRKLLAEAYRRGIITNTGSGGIAVEIG